MFKKILVPVDLTEPEFAKPAIDTAVALARTSDGEVRIVNVLPMTPVMLAEYEKRMTPEPFDEFVREYRARLLPRFDETRPFFYPFKRILCWGQRA